MKYSHVLFDLDGTIVESGPGIIASARHALQSMGRDPNAFDYSGIIGPPLMYSFQHKFGFNRDDAVKAVKSYREYYIETGMYQSRLYDGIANAIRALCQNGQVLLLATSKVENQAVKVLSHFGLAGCFAFIGGAASDDSRNTKTAVLRHVLANHPLPDPKAAIMVGDREHDIEGAHEVGLPCAAVLYGYGSRAEFEAYGAEFIVQDVAGLQRLLMQ